jgi:hypothetical protein
MSWMDKLKKAGKGMVDAGAKTMLRVRHFDTRPCLLEHCLMFWFCPREGGASLADETTVLSYPSTHSLTYTISCLPMTKCPRFQTDIVFLEREIKNRKQKFGIEIYDLMEELENSTSLSVSEKESKIRASFDAARKDIAVIQAKKECKEEEMAVMEAEAGAEMAASTKMDISGIPPSSGTVLMNGRPTAPPS